MCHTKELEYPFDAVHIIRNKKKFKRQLLELKKNFVEKKIAILGGSTTSGIKDILEIFLLNYGINPIFYESEYNRYYEDSVFENSELAEFQPDIIYIHTTNRNVTAYPKISDDKTAIENLIDNEFGKFENIWESLTSKYHCPLIQNNFEMPLFRLLGNKDSSDIHGAVNFLTRLNLKFYEYAQTHENFFICDINYISADYGLKEWANPFYWYLYKYALCVEAIPFLSFNVANIIKSVFGKNKKCLVLDLDNTLWGGVIGEDGVENIKIGSEESEGQSYSEFQSYIKSLKQLGIILAVNSKNDYENAIAGLNHTSGILRPEDFVSIKSNWMPKDKNLTDIAAELNILPESFVFVDDNPAERHIVSENLPEVSVPEIDESHQYIQIIDRNGFFETTTLSNDDLKRNEMYQQNSERVNFQAKFKDYGEYLQSLKMTAVIKPFSTAPEYMARIAQLTNKSNQFNLTTKRYTQADIEKISADSDFITLYGKVADRFGDNGVVSVVIGKIEGNVCHIELWLMSCRVLKRDVEFAMMDMFIKKCRQKNIQTIYGYYYPTAKNNIVKDFYATQNFQKLSEDENGNSKWVYRIEENYINKNKFIKVEE